MVNLKQIALGCALSALSINSTVAMNSTMEQGLIELETLDQTSEMRPAYVNTIKRIKGIYETVVRDGKDKVLSDILRDIKNGGEISNYGELMEEKNLYALWTHALTLLNAEFNQQEIEELITGCKIQNNLNTAQQSICFVILRNENINLDKNLRERLTSLFPKDLSQKLPQASTQDSFWNLFCCGCCGEFD